MSAANDHEVRFQRGNHVVSDLDRALTFYCEILGMSLEFRKDSEPDSYSYPVFGIPREAKLRFAVLNTPTQPRVMALTEVRGVPLPPAPLPRRSAIVLHIPDIDGVVRASRKAGLHIYPEEQLVTNDGRTGREVGIVDHDGNLVVIYHITAQAP
jgi:catechol 2,3-dioxygenase-like lactoylglutathione lyase family enzyme